MSHFVIRLRRLERMTDESPQSRKAQMQNFIDQKKISLSFFFQRKRDEKKRIGRKIHSSHDFISIQRGAYFVILHGLFNQGFAHGGKGGGEDSS